MISIITPTYNSEKYLEACIQSIFNQSYKDYEHIIVDGASSDRTIEIIKNYEHQYNLRYISEKDQGMYDAITKGFNMAKGDILCWLNSDDMYMPWTLELIARIFSNPKIHWVTGIPSQFSEDGINYCRCNKLLSFPRSLIYKGWMDGRRLGFIQQESTFWTRQLYDRAGGLNPNYSFAGDYHLWRSFARHESLYVVNSVLAGFRRHRGQKSEDKYSYYNEIGSAHRLTGLYSKLKLYSARRLLISKLGRNRFLRVEDVFL